MKQMVVPALALGLLTLSACATLTGPSDAKQGLAFAQAHCASCHGVKPGTISSNPEAPSFAAIANIPGLTHTSLQTFLRDSHNYPAAMNFTLQPADVDALASYMVTLQSPDYHPGI